MTTRKDLLLVTIKEIRNLAHRQGLSLPTSGTKADLIQAFLKAERAVGNRKKPGIRKAAKTSGAPKTRSDDRNGKTAPISRSVKTASASPQKKPLPKSTRQPPVVKTRKAPNGQVQLPPIPSRSHGLKVLPDESHGWEQIFNRDHVTLLLRDPNWIYAYWSIRSPTLESIRSGLTRGDTGETRLCLRLYMESSENGLDRRLAQEHFPLYGTTSYYLHLLERGQKCQAEIGFVTQMGQFLLVATSNSLRIPPDRIQPTMDSSWITLDNYRQIFTTAPRELEVLEGRRQLLHTALDGLRASQDAGAGASHMRLELSSQAIQELSSFLLQKISSASLESMSSAAIRKWSSQVLSELSSQVLSRLSSETLQQWSSEVLGQLSSQTLQTLSSQAGMELSSQALSHLSSQVIQALSSKSLGQLSSQALQSISSQIGLKLSSQALAGLSSEVFQILSSMALGALSSQAALFLSSQVLQQLSSQSLSTMSSQVLNQLSSQLSGLIASQESSFLSSSIWNQWSSQVLGSIGSSSVNSSVFNVGSSPGFQGGHFSSAHTVSRSRQSSHSLPGEVGRHSGNIIPPSRRG